jgi:DNA polymerase II small subunit
MDRRQIVESFLQKGKLLTPEALDFLEVHDIATSLGKEYDDILLNEKTISAQAENTIKIIKNLTFVPKEITKNDFVNFYSSKYEKMRQIITERIKKDFVSLNKIDSFRNEIFVIGMIREITEKEDKTNMLIEDLTASKPILFGTKIEGIELDDIVVVKAISGGNVLFGKDIYFPDIPIRSPVTGKGKVCFISDLHLDEVPKKDAEIFFQWFENQNIKYLFVCGDTKDKKLFEEFVSQYCRDKKIFIIPGHRDIKHYPTLAEPYENENIISLSNPSLVELNGLKILLMHHGCIDVLKKRYLGKSEQILKEDYLILDVVPDIVHVGHSHDPQVTNYKSVTIVNSGSLLTTFKPVVIDFATREAEQINLLNA